MAFIFYDFETSGRDPICQIISYSFILTDDDYEPIDECSGFIRLKPCELPDIGAIQVTNINIDELEKNGISEWDAAKIIADFLSRCINRFPSVTLVGFNSNSFDLQFLRNLLIRYGINPYFYGKLKNKDILHFALYLGYRHADTFPWAIVENDRHSYYQCKLETLANTLGVLSGSQSHDARDDVFLTIDVLKYLEAEFSTSFKTFHPAAIADDAILPSGQVLGKQRIRHFAPPGHAPEPFVYRYLFSLAQDKTVMIMLDLEAYEKRDSNDEKAILNTLRYLNTNKHDISIEALNDGEKIYWEPYAHEIMQDSDWSSLTVNRYFEKTKKDWDIDYQIHELGFERIDVLASLISELSSQPDHYSDIINRVWQQRKDIKDRYLVQLLNRFYLNNIPNVPKELKQKYGIPRYITGSMLRDTSNFMTLNDRITYLDTLIKNTNDTQAPALHALQKRQKVFLDDLSVN